MKQTIFATKVNMGQAWTKSGKRMAITKLMVGPNVVVGEKQETRDGYHAFQIGYGQKKMKNMAKPLKAILEKSGFSFGVRQIKEVRTEGEATMKVGDTVNVFETLQVGDTVNVQGIMKGRGFAGVMKRHGFHGGPATHGQSDRQRAPGSIGNRTTPGRVFKGKRMAGHYGNVPMSVMNLQVVYVNPEQHEIWLNGPVPGHFDSTVRLEVIGNKEFEGLDMKALDLEKPVKVEEPKVVAEADSVTEEAPAAEEAKTE